MTEFITARYPDAEMPKVQSRAEMRRRLRRFLRGRARLREVGEDFGPWRSEPDAIERVLGRVDRMGCGPKIIVQRELDMEQLSIREVRAEPTVADLGCNPRIERSHALTYAEFKGQLRSGGIWLCRYIDGKRTVSKHGYLGSDGGQSWKGGAEDTFVTTGGMVLLEEVAAFKVRNARQGTLTLSTVIVNRTIWTAPSWDPRPYGGNQHFHVHEDAPGGAACRP